MRGFIEPFQLPPIFQEGFHFSDLIDCEKATAKFEVKTAYNGIGR
jgi:hypothetical protein